MKMRTCLMLGLALVLGFTLSVGLQSGSQAQQYDPAISYGPAGQSYDPGYYGYGSTYGGAYCPMWSGPGYSGPSQQGYRKHSSRPWGRGHRGAWRSQYSGYANGYRGGWGSCW